MQNILIIILFLIAKIFQWLNGFVLTRILSNDEGYTIMISAYIFIIAILVFGLLVKKFLPKLLGVAWIAIVSFLIILALVNCSWAIIFLAGLFWYALIGVEGQVLQSFSNCKNIPQFMPFLLSLMPVIIFSQISQSHIIASQIFYIINSVLAFLSSYFARKYSGGKVIIYGKAPPIWLGLSFIAGSGILYYLGFYGKMGTPHGMFIAFVLLFYVGGASAIYMSIDERLEQMRKI